jgi:hypothetical protein
MPAVNKRINFAFDRGDRVWLVCDPSVSGFVVKYEIGAGYLPSYVVSFAGDVSLREGFELTAEQPAEFPDPEEDE